jgi:hypothetical protein
MITSGTAPHPVRRPQRARRHRHRPLHAAPPSRRIHPLLNTVEREVAADKSIHVVLDNYATHKHPKVLASAGAPSALDLPLHPDLGVLAQCCGEFLLQDHASAHPQPQTLRLDSIRRSHSGQTRPLPCTSRLSQGTSEVRIVLAAGGRWIRTIRTPQFFGQIYRRLGANGFWVMTALCALALPVARNLSYAYSPRIPSHEKHLFECEVAH